MRELFVRDDRGNVMRLHPADIDWITKGDGTPFNLYEVEINLLIENEDVKACKFLQKFVTVFTFKYKPHECEAAIVKAILSSVSDHDSYSRLFTFKSVDERSLKYA